MTDFERNLFTRICLLHQLLQPFPYLTWNVLTECRIKILREKNWNNFSQVQRTVDISDKRKFSFAILHIRELGDDKIAAVKTAHQRKRNSHR